MKTKLTLLALILLVVTVFFLADGHQLLTLDTLRDSLDTFHAWRDRQPLLVSGGFFLIYVAVTALSLPGAAVMTLAGGALFGLLWGVLLISFASTIGATLAFLVSRYLLRDWVQERFGARLKPINRGIEKEGGFYLFTLRLVPLFPFFLINLLMGLTPIRTFTFYWVSQVGMLAGTLVYVNAGTQLGQLQSVSGILSADLILSFALLGLFPLIARKGIGVVQRRRVYVDWTRPKSFDRNLIVIGAGAGGLVTSYIAAAVKAKVTLIEADSLGGDCLNTGCVPSKALIRSARLAQEMRTAERLGLESVQPRFSFKRVMQRVQEVIAQVEPHDSVERYTGLGVEVIQGYATLVDPWTVEIALNDGGSRRLSGRSIVLATGAAPVVPELPGIEQVDYVTSDTLWSRFAELDEAPKRLLVLGGGPIGCELAQAFARLGSQVSLVQRRDRVLPQEDEEVSALAAQSLRSSGVELLTGHTPVRCERDNESQQLVAAHRGEERAIPFDCMIVAAGRVARLSGYGLETLGIDTDRTIATNEFLETRYPHIYAVGDAAGPYQFTHVAAHQAWYAAVNGLFGHLKRFAVDYRVIPRTTFLDPEIATVGLTEQTALEQKVRYEVTRFDLDDLDRALTESATGGLIKVLTPPGSDRILGVTIVGEHAGDLLAEFVLAMKHGLGLNKILGTIHAYPTWAEGNKYAAGEWKKAHAPQCLLRWIERYHDRRRGRG
ncbi:FAD-dependent oxidoreductase [Marinobacterium sp. D7]|uniref:FAD-dependent oxidoreductase n=1 Tax=Marinobacterium ramblicola TaxID=2849041 RepID=UPI001C2D9D42|nr:bifunctional TVP38/TMEM64 family protein/FAD-dependent oxidoreductase [Marinobacterium ramblicola]MBV1790666.1 FAD-dependent oxidoreductase [Marinobacterium ramblicola]